MRIWIVALAAFALVGIGCGSDTEETRAGVDGFSGANDATTADIAVADDVADDVATVTDAGRSDAGRQDAGRQDAGPTDAGPTDTGPIDAGPVDAGPMDTHDAGTEVHVLDAGPVDAVSEDAGTIDEFFWVRITDNPLNSSLQVCIDVFASPGADIDAISLYRGGELLGHATMVTGMLNTDPNMTGAPCANDYDDLKDTEGAPDGGEETGFTSLNGGYLIFRFEGHPEIKKGDFISVVELGTEIAGVPESYTVDIGQGSAVDGEWVAQGELHSGSQDIEVDF